MKVCILFCRVILLLGLLTAHTGSAASISEAHHDLHIDLDLEAKRLQATDTITFGRADALELHLNPRADVASVTREGKPLPFTFSGGLLRVARLRSGRQPVVEIRYGCRFDDPAPKESLSTHDPSYGVTGTIGPEGVLLLAGARWYPSHPSDSGMTLSVRAPKGFLAVTSGRLIGHSDEGDRTVSRWELSPMTETPSLSAGPFFRRTRQAGRILVATYFTPPLQSLAPGYLDAAADYLSLYEELFGPYPFPQFAVVENFFPTGYGFPGYTLIGGRVLRLPFIIHTSLGHEIAHCWWGNGVRVDYSQGNWSEGLTTYVAEHLYEERRSPEAARRQRKEWLRNYAALVPEGGGFPLSRFLSRTDPISKTIGYDKGAMVFHMLRREIGDGAFWRALRGLYAERLFKKASWSDLRAVFEKEAGRSLGVFFAQWVDRPGAPRLVLENMETVRTPGGYAVIGTLVQEEAVYTLSVPVLLETEAGELSQTLSLTEARTTFRLESASLPRRLRVDPGADLLRLLAPEEIPPIVNHLKSAGRVRFVVGPELGPEGLRLAKRLQISLGIEAADIVSGKDPGMHDADAVVWIGTPPDDFVSDLPASFRSSPGENATLFAVFRKNDTLAAVLLPASDPELAGGAAIKITHYGKYSYLTFEGTQNTVKGTWPAADSPLIYSRPDASPKGKRSEVRRSTFDVRS